MFGRSLREAMRWEVGIEQGGDLAGEVGMTDCVVGGGEERGMICLVG